MTWGWVYDERTFIFGWTNPLMFSHGNSMGTSVIVVNWTKTQTYKAPHYNPWWTISTSVYCLDMTTWPYGTWYMRSRKRIVPKHACKYCPQETSACIKQHKAQETVTFHSPTRSYPWSFAKWVSPMWHCFFPYSFRAHVIDAFLGSVSVSINFWGRLSKLSFVTHTGQFHWAVWGKGSDGGH